jgi:hypothetical protein
MDGKPAISKISSQETRETPATSQQQQASNSNLIKVPVNAPPAEYTYNSHTAPYNSQVPG